MSYFIRNGNSYRVCDEDSIEVTKHLPAGNYIVKFDQMSNQYFCEKVDGFEFKGKCYGSTIRDVDRIMNTFRQRSTSTGVMLTGEKGTGKSLTAKLLCIKGFGLGIPTLIINSSFTGDTFNKFIQDIEQECIILFDEFEKIFDTNDQEKLLTLLDGVFPSKKLFVITCNDKYRVDSHMRNRPGRIFYLLNFGGLEESFVREYCQDNLIDKDQINDICRVASIMYKFTFDQLQALVEEMNRYNESAESALRMLNVSPEYSSDMNYEITVKRTDGSFISPSKLHNKRWEGNPLDQDGFHVQFSDTQKSGKDTGIDATLVDDDEDADGKWVCLKLTPDKLSSMVASTGTFVFETSEGYTVLLTRAVPETKPYHSLLV